MVDPMPSFSKYNYRARGWLDAAVHCYGGGLTIAQVRVSETCNIGLSEGLPHTNLICTIRVTLDGRLLQICIWQHVFPGYPAAPCRPPVELSIFDANRERIWPTIYDQNEKIGDEWDIHQGVLALH